MTLTSNGQFISINFFGCLTCDVAPCQSIVMIQTVRPRADDGSGVLTKYTYAQQNLGEDGARNDSLLTALGLKVDVPLSAQVPYYLGTYLGSTLPIARTAVKDGSCEVADIMDNPNRTLDSFQPSVVAIVFDFEVNVFCAAGGGIGQWLGRCTWTWRMSDNGQDAITPGTCTRANPSAEFLDALSLWASRRGFVMPTPSPPATGGTSCN